MLIVTSLLLAQIITAATIFSLSAAAGLSARCALEQARLHGEAARRRADAGCARDDPGGGASELSRVDRGGRRRRRIGTTARMTACFEASGRELGERFTVFATGSPHQHGDGGVQIGIVLPDGSAIMAPLPPPPPRGLGLTPPLLSTLVFLASRHRAAFAVGDADADRAVDAICRRGGAFHRRRRRRAAERARPRRNPQGRGGAERDARADSAAGGRPHPDAGRGEPRSAGRRSRGCACAPRRSSRSR